MVSSMQLASLNHIPRFGGVEFSTFELKEGITETELFAAIDEAVTGFMFQQKGFLGHAIFKNSANTYVDVLFATSRAEAEEICGKWIGNPFVQQYLECIKKGSETFSFWDRVK